MLAESFSLSFSPSPFFPSSFLFSDTVDRISLSFHSLPLSLCPHSLDSLRSFQVATHFASIYIYFFCFLSFFHRDCFSFTLKNIKSSMNHFFSFLFDHRKNQLLFFFHVFLFLSSFFFFLYFYVLRPIGNILFFSFFVFFLLSARACARFTLCASTIFA